MASLMDILRQAGFTGQGLQMAYAIAMAESSGDAHAHNGNAGTGDNSYGLFQINMLGGMGPERRAQYGLSSNDALFDPLTNARVAYKMSHGGTNWGPWSTYTSGAYRQYLGGSGATVSYSGSGGGTAPVTATLDPDELASEYGLTSSLINSNGELKRLFNQAVSGQWSAAKFGAALKNTKWWQTQSDTLRKYVTLKYTDPATWNQNWWNAQAKLVGMAVQVGLDVKGLPKGFMSDAVYKSLALGWSDAQMKNWLGSRVGTHGGVMWGEAGDAWDKLHTIAYTNGMGYSWQWYRDRSREIVSGKSTQETVEAQIRAAAAARYSGFRDQILAGQNAIDLAAPYIKSVSSLLELPETDVDLFNKHVADAMHKATPLWQFENEVRSDPLWTKTKNAQDSMMGIAHQVAKDFGLAY